MAKLFLISIFLLSARSGPAGCTIRSLMGSVLSGSPGGLTVPGGTAIVIPVSPAIPTDTEASGSSFVNSQDVTSDQGIEGIVYPVSGNRMPAPNRKPVSGGTAGSASPAGGSPAGQTAGASSGGSSGTSAGESGRFPRGVKSTVYVFELTNISQVTRQGQTSYYVVVNTKLVKQADTDDTGYFKISLPPGRYSVFTRKGDLFYASRRDEKNNIAPVEVVDGKFTRVDCKIEGDRKAVY